VPFGHGFAKSQVHYDGHYTEEGLEAMEKLVERMKAKGFAVTFGEPTKSFSHEGKHAGLIQRGFTIENVDPELARELQAEFIDEYRQAIAMAGDDQDARRLACTTLRFNLAKSHLYDNGNGRLGMVVMESCLIENGMRPVFIVSSGLSPNEMMQSIKNIHGKLEGKS